MIREVLFEIPHIKFVILDDGEYCLVVEDTELNDYVEDFIYENGIEIENVSLDNENGLSIYYNYFEGNLEAEKLIVALKKFDVKEVEAIFKINN